MKRFIPSIPDLSSREDSSHTGEVEIEITAFDDGDPRFQRIDEAGQRKNDGLSLAYLLKAYGGHEFDLVDPIVKARHRISLKPWADKDSERTFLRISFKKRA